MAVCAADFVIFSPNDTMCSCPTPCYDCFVEHVLYHFGVGGGGGIVRGWVWCCLFVLANLF